MRIVIIEDEIRIREGLVKLVRKLNSSYEVVGEAGNGKDGLNLVSRELPDVIITDIKMPEMDGLEMLTVLHERGLMKKAIVLSAYSEFEYARQAMRMGVKEYLLKPIVVSDIAEAIRRVEREIHQESLMTKDIFESAEQIFSAILTGTLAADEQIQKRIAKNWGIPKDAVYQGICLYLGGGYGTEKEQARKELERMLSQREKLKFLILEAEREKTLVVLACCDQGAGELERWVQYRLLQDRNRTVRGAVGFISNLHPEDIKTEIDTLMEYMDWNISLGDGILISYPKITKLQTSPCVYPMEAENRMKLSICTGETARIKKSLEEFRGYFTLGKVYHPREIKECYVRFLWALINTGKEVGILKYESLEQQKLLEQIMGARTMKELNEVGIFLLEKLCGSKEEATHLMVKRAQSMIHEFYQTGITLEEIAAKLNITPEYLGTRFHQEMGITFSSYMKKFRMTKAKELLIGTNLKLYEIADKIGYAEPKYFSRVFKEETGQLPADYRKTHK